MPKRTDRTRVMDHEMHQLETLKTLEPNTTPARWRPFSDALVDVAIEALRIARELEAGRKLDRYQIQHLVSLVRQLPDAAPRKSPDETSDEE